MTTIPAFCRLTADVCHRQLIARRRSAMGLKSAWQADFVRHRGCDRVLPPIEVHILAGQLAEAVWQESQAHYRSISALEQLEQYGGIGSVPTDINPTWIWRRASQPDQPALQPAAITTRLVWCLGKSWWSWLCAPAPALRLTGRFRGGAGL